MAIEALEQELIGTARSLGAYLESQIDNYRLADPLEPYLGPDGSLWESLDTSTGWHLGDSCVPYRDPDGLNRMRKVCRHFANENPFAINGHENRISYVVGYGHVYTVTAKGCELLPGDIRERAQEIIDDFIRINRWNTRQQQNVLRRDRDGEVFTRMFPHEDGILRVRYVEPEAVYTPQEESRNDNCSFGIRTQEDDLETVLSYFVDGEEIDAGEIQHRKRGTFAESKRGVSIYWAVRHNLVRAMKILRNGSTVTEIQTAIGMIRRFVNATQSTVTAWAQSNSTSVRTGDRSQQPNSGQSMLQKFAPGSILNTNANLEYEFPAMGLDPSRYVESLQAELRAIAARLVMPEFMFTSKSDDANRAAAFAAEGPAVKMFERLQWDEIEYDLEIMNRVLDHAADSGLLTMQQRQAVSIDVQPPTVHVRDKEAEARTREIDIRSGLLSAQTATAESGRDYLREQSNIEEHHERTGLPVSNHRPSDFLNSKPPH
jgi:hypothetical protein